VDSSGTVIGHAYVNPDTGMYESDKEPTTIVKETIRAESGGGRTGGGGSPEGAGGTGVPVVDESGTVVGRAYFDPSTGRYQTDYEESTTVYETSHPSGTNGGGGTGASGDGGEQRPEGSDVVAADDEAPEPTGGTPFYINPDVFRFARSSPNWQQSGCVAIVFGYGSPFLPMTIVKVGVTVGAPITLRDGRALSEREAQLDSANAAQSAALLIKERLDSNTLGLAEVQPTFVSYMDTAIRSTGLGYRVSGCRPQ
jgi:hypothetical protein